VIDFGATGATDFTINRGNGSDVLYAAYSTGVVFAGVVFAGVTDLTGLLGFAARRRRSSALTA